MSTILVSILSKHTLPNYLFIKEMEGKYDELVFITTPEADKDNRDMQMEHALGIEERTAVYISVDGNDYHQVLSQMKNAWPKKISDKYLVNLTGGTKMMSLAVHDYFLSDESKFYYVPIGQNKYNDLSTGEWRPINYRASLKEYLTLYGLKFTCDNTLTYPESYTLKQFDIIRSRHFKLTWRMWHAHDEDNNDSTTDKRYFGGGWFEEYTFLRIKKQYNLRDEDIALSLKIYRNTDDMTNDNELDVAFMLDNTLNVIECKMSMIGNGKPQQTIEEYLYKLAAISKDFGLQVRSYLFTLYNMDKLPSSSFINIQKRCRILGIRGIVGPKELSETTLIL